MKITLATQRLEVMDSLGSVAGFSVSTALRGGGERMDSLRTPRGDHEVRHMIGADCPLGTVFRERQETGEVWSRDLHEREPGRDWILTRIIWLGGLEDGRNRGGSVDTYARHIYIHGTPDPEPMGVPRSHGCVRMRNTDVLQLFDMVAVGTRVRIG